jgi:hypothetical protein
VDYPESARHGKAVSILQRFSSRCPAYFVKGHTKGRKGRRKYQRRQATAVIGASGDPVAAITKVKHLADELGGMKKLRALVVAMS